MKIMPLVDGLGGCLNSVISKVSKCITPVEGKFFLWYLFFSIWLVIVLVMFFSLQIAL